ncbi:MAG: HD domain-containing protein [Puniceicoccales bacterium]|jgi:3'-5' exoribonuclease|nr:HD domain-containing protein [Puniceicoccales bacterium]
MHFWGTRELKAIGGDKEVRFTSVLLLRKVETRHARNGSEYLKIELGDKSGSFGCTCFESHSSFTFFKTSKAGEILQVEGMNRYYQGNFNPDLVSVKPLSEAEIVEGNWRALLTEGPEEAKEALAEEFWRQVENIQHESLRETIRSVFQELGEGWMISPAARSMHHAYPCGLLEHTVHVVRAGIALLPLYPEIQADLAIAGMLAHDVGKVLEYTNDSVPERTKLGTLQGHIILGYRLVRKAALKNKLDPELTERLEHMVISHQGEPEWGAAVRPATPEAVFVSLVDNLDAKMGMVKHLLQNTPPNASFSERFPGLESQLLVEIPKI